MNDMTPKLQETFFSKLWTAFLNAKEVELAL